MKVGKNGKDGVSITGPDTANGTDGKVAVTDKMVKKQFLFPVRMA